MFPPCRIVCLTEETVETLYLLGEEARIVGVSGYAVRPPRVRKEKPRVSAFISADVPKILALVPDLVLAFSDLQADIVAELVRANVAVHAFNQRDVAGILDMIRTLGALVGSPAKAEALAARLAGRVEAARERSRRLPRHPRVYFEEWDEPMISGLGWVSELVEAAGGIDVFPQLAARKNAKDRIVTPQAVIEARPDLIIGSWCGKKFVPADRRPPRFCASARRRRRLAARNQVGTDPAAGPGGAHRRARCLVRHRCRMGRRRHRRCGRLSLSANTKEAAPMFAKMPKPARAPADLWTDLALIAFLVGFDVVARLLPHAPGFMPIAASALFAGRMLRSPRLPSWCRSLPWRCRAWP